MTEHAVPARLVRIDPVRRHYNRWVRNQVLEDYALRFTAIGSRRWSCGQVANTAIGAGSFLALEAIGAAITLQYGFTNAVAAIGVVCALIFAISLPIAYHAARIGVDIDLLTRGAGFGYLGSTITSLIYASFTFIFFAIEAAIMATVLELCFGLPLSVGYLVSSLLVIPIVLYGITLIGRFQRLTQPLWIALQLAPFVLLAWYGTAPLDAWQGFAGGVPAEPSGGIDGGAPPGSAGAASNGAAPDGGFELLRFGAASAVVFALVAQIGEQVDYLRFLPPRTARNRVRWWTALLVAGPGWIGIGALKLLAGSFLVVLALEGGALVADAAEPVTMYLVAWELFLPHGWALAVTGGFVVVCQTKINVTNAYAGSIAWSNFFSRLTHSHPGRVVWVVFNVAIALLLMELGVYTSLEHTLSLYSLVAVAWIGALASDLAIARSLGLSPDRIEFKRAHLYDVNPVGTGAMIAGAAVGLLAYTGTWGETARALAGFLALATSVALVPALAWSTGGRFYLARRVTPAAAPDGEDGDGRDRCRVCEHDFEPGDLTACPAYGGSICSLCCTLDNRCEDRCRPGARASEQVLGALERIVPDRLHRYLRAPIARYLALLSLVGLALAFTTTLVFLESGAGSPSEREVVHRALLHLFVVLFIAAGVVTWIFLLISDSRRAAYRESSTRNVRLVAEIEAHERTERALEQAKEAAETANQAKSRYLLGLGHELRSPLNSILGYAQLLDADPHIPPARHGAVRVIRQSSDHLAGLIESLLDISKIEAGRLSIAHERIELRTFLEQIADMFRLRANARGLAFEFDVAASVPSLVHADGSRLRQVLINLLSNAIRCTERGTVRFAVEYRSQVAVFTVADTGVGIAPDDLERIFQPFETARRTSGTGLGLTITKLLAGIMGGDVEVESAPGVGSTFTVRLLLSSIEESAPASRPRGRLVGYAGRRRSVVVVDDDVAHRSLMTDLLAPLGFRVHAFADAEHCLAALTSLDVDVCLLDISLPGMDGRTLEKRLRERLGARTALVIVSANVDERPRGHIHDLARENHFVKPVDLDRLLARLGDLLGLDWLEESAETPARPAPGEERPDTATLATLAAHSSVGDVRAMRDVLSRLLHDAPGTDGFVATLSARLDAYDLAGAEAFLSAVRADGAGERATNDGECPRAAPVP